MEDRNNTTDRGNSSEEKLTTSCEEFSIRLTKEIDKLEGVVKEKLDVLYKLLSVL